MTEGRDGIWLAPNGAPGLMRVARRLSVVAAMLAIAAFVAGTAGSGYAGSGLLDPVTVSNYGGTFGGTLSTFPAGSGHHAKPASRVKGNSSLLSIGPYGDAVSSVDGSIAVPLPFDFVGQSASNPSVQAPINALFDFLHLPPPLIGCGTFGFPTTAPLFGTGLVGIFSQTASGNSAPATIICAPGFSIGGDGQGLVPGQFLNTAGVFTPQGVAFESPFDGNPNVPAGHEILAVANVFPEVDQDAAECAAAGLPTVTLGTITMYDRKTLTPGLNNAAPFQNNPVSAINPLPATGVPPVNPPTGVLYTQNATIAGCLSALAGPRNLAFDGNGFLFVVNDAPPLNATLQAVPHFVSVYGAGMYGDVFPTALIGINTPANETSGTLIDPIGIAVATLGFEDDLIFVTDVGDNSIKIFNPFTNSNPLLGFAFAGELVGTIQGSSTKLKHPEGIALSADGDTLYVVNNLTATLSMFTDIMTKTTGGDIAPTLSISGNQANMNFPTGAAVFPQFVKPSM